VCVVVGREGGGTRREAEPGREVFQIDGRGKTVHIIYHFNTHPNRYTSQMTVDYLKAILEQEKLKHEQLEEECGLITNLLLRKHYRNISESQFCSSMRRKHM
jgi:hypothetical protein